MPAKLATGKSTEVVTPPVGTTNKSRSSKTSSLVKLTDESKKLKSSIKKTEDGSPTEIIAYADFNRVYDGNGAELPYGKYYKTLDVLHSVMTDDVKYFIEKSLENDTAGEWSSLKTKVDNDIADTDDLINDLANVDISIENAISSMDVLKLNDEEFQQFAKDYLSAIVKVYEKKPEDRILTIDEIITFSDSQTKASDYFATPGGRILAFRSIIKNFIDRFQQPENFKVLSSKSVKDLNPFESLDGIENFWPTLLKSSFVDDINTLSKVFSYSYGIQAVKNDSLSSRISFNGSNLISPFVGCSLPTAAAAAGLKIDLPIKTQFPAESAVGLSLFQFLNSRNDYVIVPEIEDTDKKSNYLSGPNGLVRSAIFAGDYEFSDMNNFQKNYDKSMENLSSYIDKMLGMTDTSSEITPAEIFRIILKNFNAGLELAKSNDDSLYQLLYLSLVNQSPNPIITTYMYHQFLRILSKIQYYVVYSEGPADPGEDRKPKTTLKTTGENEGKSFDKDGNGYTTTQVEDKTKPVFDITDDPRIIKRLSSGSPDRDNLSILLLAFFRKFQNIKLEDEVRQKIKEIDEEIENLKNKKSDQDRGRGQDSDNTAENLANEEDIENQIKKLKRKKEKLKTSSTTNRHNEEKISEYFSDGMKKTSGTFWSTAVQAYNEIIEKSIQNLPDGVKITDDVGRTLYGQFEETGLLALIAKIYVEFANLIKFGILKEDSNDEINAILTSIKTEDGISDELKDSFLGKDKQDKNKPKISIFGYDEDDLQLLINEINDILSSSIKDLENKKFKFVKPAFINYQIILLQTEVIQNSMAFLTAYGKDIDKSRKDLVETFADLFENVNRKNAFDNLKGRNLISNLTKQQIIYRRSLLDKYRPDSTKGYLPERISYSAQESLALDKLLKSPIFSNKKSENFRIISAGLPSKTISSISYKDKDIGPQNYSGLIELAFYKRDHEFGEIIFKENVKLFDPSLYIIPKSFRKYETANKSITGNAGLDVGKQIFFYLYDRGGVTELNYEKFMEHKRYSSLSNKTKKELISNTVISYLLETYIYKITGMIYDEASSFNLSNDVSLTSLSSLNRIADKQISNLKLPLSSEIAKIIDSEGKLLNPVDAGTGDIELILNIAGSAMMKSTTQLDLLIENSKFDRTFTAVIDPDDFKIDKETKNDEFGKAMIRSLTRSEFLKDDQIISRDPISGGFSIGDITCQFIPHTIENKSVAMLNVSKAKSQKSKKLK